MTIPEDVESRFYEYLEKQGNTILIEDLYDQFMEDISERQVKYLLKQAVEKKKIEAVKRGEYRWIEVPVPAEVPIVETKDETKIETETKPIVETPIIETKPVVTETSVETKELEIKEEIVEKKEEKKEPAKPEQKEPDFLAKKRKEIEEAQTKKQKTVKKYEEKKEKEPEVEDIEKPKKTKKESFPWILVGIIGACVVAVLVFVKYVLNKNKKKKEPEEKQPEPSILRDIGVKDASELF